MSRHSPFNFLKSCEMLQDTTFVPNAFRLISHSMVSKTKPKRYAGKKHHSKCDICDPLRPSHPPSSITSTRHWFLNSQAPQKKIFQRQHYKKHPIAKKGSNDHEERYTSVQVIMVSGRDNRNKNPARIPNGEEEIKELPRLRLPSLSRLE